MSTGKFALVFLVKLWGVNLVSLPASSGDSGKVGKPQVNTGSLGGGGSVVLGFEDKRGPVFAGAIFADGKAGGVLYIAPCFAFDPANLGDIELELPMLGVINLDFEGVGPR